MLLSSLRVNGLGVAVVNKDCSWVNLLNLICRLLETCRERLVLILLEDIPARKRPKTLGYLMKTKTYIKWPLARDSGQSEHSLSDERKIFWKRLRRALIDTDWETDAS